MLLLGSLIEIEIHKQVVNEILHVMVEKYALFFSLTLLGRIPLEIASFGYFGITLA